MKYTKLTIMKEADFNPKRRHTVFVCKCDCGKILNVSKKSLETKRVQSCGCYSKGEARRTHGCSSKKSPHYDQYQVWKAMKRRCFNKQNKDYPSYGGRGVTVCDRWLIFQNFIDDMGPCPKGKSIDRIDFNGNYEPSNCRWATVSQQQSNKRNAVLLTLNGKVKNLNHWAKELGIKRTTIAERLKRGWTVEKALNQITGEF